MLLPPIPIPCRPTMHVDRSRAEKRAPNPSNSHSDGNAKYQNKNTKLYIQKKKNASGIPNAFRNRSRARAWLAPSRPIRTTHLRLGHGRRGRTHERGKRKMPAGGAGSQVTSFQHILSCGPTRRREKAKKSVDGHGVMARGRGARDWSLHEVRCGAVRRNLRGYR